MFPNIQLHQMFAFIAMSELLMHKFEVLKEKPSCFQTFKPKPHFFECHYQM